MRKLTTVVALVALGVLPVVACSGKSYTTADETDGGAEGGVVANDGGTTTDGSAFVTDAGNGADSGPMRRDGGVATAPKPPLAGLVDMEDISWHNTAGAEPAFVMSNVALFPGVFGGVVINATWAFIEPTQGAALDFSKIDAALTQVDAYNAAHPTAPLGTKLRIYSGANAPAWAKVIGGGPVDIQRNPQGCQSGNCPLQIGLMWTADYITAWRAFQAKVAARYDNDPLVRHITVTSCAQQTDEPFVSTVDATSKMNLKTALFTDDQQKACLTGAVDDYGAWNLTNVDYTFNAFLPTMGMADSTVFPETVMTACRAKFGTRCVLANHALSAPLRASDQGIYDEIGNTAQNGPVSFQTDAPQKMGCLWVQTVAQGIALGASSVEVWPKATLGGFDGFTLADMTQLAAQFQTPVAVDPNPVPLPLPCSGFH